MRNLIFAGILLIAMACNTTGNETKNSPHQEIGVTTVADEQKVFYKKLNVNGIDIAYREAGNPENPTLVLLHGFPSSSHQYRKVLAQLSDEFHLVAPDYPGFGNSDFPSKEEYEYTFDNLAKTIDAFLEKKKLTSYALMIQDYGAPIGFRIATAHPERVTAIVNQNGNAYEEGLGEAWAGIRALWADRNKDTEKELLPAFSLEGLEWQYTHGTRNPEKVNPDTWHLDYLRLSRPNAHSVNLDLFYDYRNNLKLYPKWQQYLRDHQPPLLIVWGKNDAFFPESGAEAYKRDVKEIDYNIYDTGHFALEEEGNDIIKKMRNFLKKKVEPKNDKMVSDTEDKDKIRLLRNATLVVDFGGKKFLIDPMFADKGAFPAFDGAGNDFRNPMVELPISEDEVLRISNEVDAVFITHTHVDHWDPKAQNTIAKDKPIFVQPADVKLLKDQGFTNVTVIQDTVDWQGITIHRTGGQHGFGKVGELMGDVSGFVFSKKDKKLYIAGDTRWAPEVENALKKYNPDIIVLNAGGAQFIEGNKKGDAITMTPEDVIEVQKNAPNANILTVHMNTLNHCFVKRNDLKEVLIKTGIQDLIEIPEDGDTFFLQTK